MQEQVRKIVEALVNKLFVHQKSRLLGGRYAKTIGFSFKNFDPKFTLPYLYTHANLIHNFNREGVDQETVQVMNDNVLNFLNTLQQKTMSDITRSVSERIEEARQKSKMKDVDISSYFSTEDGARILGDIKQDLDKQKTKINSHMEAIVNTGMHQAQNMGAVDGIVEMSKALKIDDPVVFKIGVLDDVRCIDCWKLWTLEDKVTPRLYNLSELVGDPGNKLGKRSASLGPSHPHCRDVLTTLMPGFGFDSGGKIIYIGQGHDELAKQRAA